jgi:hypothetical protein
VNATPPTRRASSAGVLRRTGTRHIVPNGRRKAEGGMRNAGSLHGRSTARLFSPFTLSFFFEFESVLFSTLRSSAAGTRRRQPRPPAAARPLTAVTDDATYTVEKCLTPALDVLTRAKWQHLHHHDHHPRRPGGTSASTSWPRWLFS